MKILISENGRKFLVEGKEIHTDLGVVKIEDDLEDVKSHLGHRFMVLEPDILDIYEKMPRSGSFILKRDIGLIIAFLGLGSGYKVVDAGTGSGALAIFMGNIVGEKGKIISYEKNPEFAGIAKKNIQWAGLSNIIEVREMDVFSGFKEEDGSIDAVTLDMNDASRVIGDCKRILKKGGRIAVYTPYLEHAKEAYNELLRLHFIDVRTIESLSREMEFKKQGSRPKTSRVGHSGYITFGRKV